MIRKQGLSAGQETTTAMPITSEKQKQQERKDQRLQCAVVVQTLLNHVLKDDVELQEDVKQVVLDCVRRNRNGDKQEFSSLSEAIAFRLQKLVGCSDWAKAMYMTRRFIASRQIQRMSQRQVVPPSS